MYLKSFLFSLLVISVISMHLPSKYFNLKEKSIAFSGNDIYYNYSNYRNYINYTNYTSNGNNTNNTNNTNYSNYTNYTNYSNRTNYTDYTNNTYYFNTTNYTNISILYAYGELYEYKRNQTLHLVVNTPINPTELYNITLINRNRTKFYMTQTICFHDNNFAYGNVTSLQCILNLEFLGKGDYFIDYFYYRYSKIYDTKTMISVQESEEKKKDNKTQEIELIFANTTGYEHMPNQTVELFFKNNNTDARLINGIEIFNNFRKYYLKLDCRSNNGSIFISCMTDFSLLDFGLYNISSLVYDYSFIYPKSYLTLYITPSSYDLELINITGEAYTKNISSVFLVFNHNISYHDFTNVTFEKEGWPFYINYSIYPSKYENIIECLLDLRNVPKGNYSINIYYRNRLCRSKVFLFVRERDIKLESHLIEVYHNFKKYNTSQIAYFSFIGNKISSDLYFVVLKDENNRKYALNTEKCTAIQNNDIQYDLRCKLNLAYVNSGKYTISEYYLGDQLYEVNKPISLIAQ